MENRSYALIAGLFILLLSIALVITAVWLSGSEIERMPYLIVTQSSVTGLNPQSKIRYRGVPVGQVESIDFDPDNFEDILIRVQIDSDIPISEDTYATLRYQGITGLAQIELADDGKDGERLKTSARDPARIPMRESLLEELTDAGKDIVDKTQDLLENLNEMVNEDSLARVKRILANMDQATARLAEVEEKLVPALETLPDLARKAKGTLVEVDKFVNNMNAVSKELREAAESGKRLGKSGEAAGQKLVETTLPRLNELLEQLSDTTAQVERLAADLERRPQSLIFGRPEPPPGPGEQGYLTPSP